MTKMNYYSWSDEPRKKYCHFPIQLLVPMAFVSKVFFFYNIFLVYSESFGEQCRDWKCLCTWRDHRYYQLRIFDGNILQKQVNKVLLANLFLLFFLMNSLNRMWTTGVLFIQLTLQFLTWERLRARLLSTHLLVPLCSLHQWASIL